MKSTSPRQRRLLLVDDNIRDVGGHYFELATLLLEGAAELGYQRVLGTHASFSERACVEPNCLLEPTFHTRRLVHWSLGVDGHSRWQRDRDGKSIGGSGLQNAWTNVVDRFRPKRPPQRMLQQWADDLANLLGRLQVNETDSLVLNTADDFAMLALAAAMRKSDSPPIRIDAIFHFALYSPGQPDRDERLRHLGQQLRAALKDLRPHDVRLHATTHNLAAQLRQSECGAAINPIPYPTRPRTAAGGSHQPPWKVVLAGLPRAEKGREAIINFLAGMETEQLLQHKYRVSIQMPTQRWQALVPTALHAAYKRAAAGSPEEPIEVMTDNLSTADYHGWLDTADVAVFLYDPQRYVARCSGVLLEMFARGVPVIVPDRCWLADQVRAAGGHRSIGFIYQHRSEIPHLLSQFYRDRDSIVARARSHAAKIAVTHCGANTLLEMGIKPVARRQVA